MAFLQDLTITVTTGLGELEVDMVEDVSEVSSINVQSFVDEQVSLVFIL